MIKYLASYAASTVTMAVLDLMWLGFIAKPIYKQGIGHLMADQPNIPVAVLFYLMYPVGLVVFAIAPTLGAAGWGKSAVLGALFGLFAYATYDLTNLATLKNWPVSLSVIDVSWGTFASAVAALAGKIVLDRLTDA